MYLLQVSPFSFKRSKLTLRIKQHSANCVMGTLTMTSFPWHDLFEMPGEMLLMFLWHLVPVVANVTLGSPHAGKPYTLQRGGLGMRLCTCVKLGGTDRHTDRQTEGYIRQLSLPCPPTTGQQQPPKTKIILLRDEAKTDKSNAVRLQNSPKHRGFNTVAVGVYHVSKCPSQTNPLRVSLRKQTKNVLWRVNQKDKHSHCIYLFRYEGWQSNKAAVYWTVNWLMKGWESTSGCSIQGCKETGWKYSTDSLSPFHTKSLLY